MSRIGKKPIEVAEGLTVKIEGTKIVISKGQDSKEYDFGNNVKVTFTDNKIQVEKKDAKSIDTKFVGLHRSNIFNIVKGLTDGFTIKLEVNGIGYKINIVGNILVLGLGYSHDINYAIPSDVKITFEKPNLIVINGINKERVGQIAAEIKSFRKTEPYKGKGVKIQGARIVRKEGKKK
jgi:large subunit ribosomal protein L6